MKYYQLMMDVSGESDIVCHYNNSFGMQEYDLCIGEEFNSWNKDFKFFYNSQEGDIATDFLANDMTWFLVSEKLRKVLDRMNTNIQYFKVDIFEENTNNTLNGYYVANILNVVDALCLEKSDYFETEIDDMGTIYTVSKYAVYKDKINGSDIFKLSNHQEIPIFVSENFKNAIEDNGITGMDFMEIHAE